MEYIRKSRPERYTVVNNDFINDLSLSWKAKGIMVYIMSLPSDRKLNVMELKECSTDGREATYSGIKELIKAGYCKRIEHRENGKIVGNEYIVSDCKEFGCEESEPYTEKPHTEKPHTEKPHTEKPHTVAIVNDISNNNDNNIYNIEDNINNNNVIENSLFQEEYNQNKPLNNKERERENIYKRESEKTDGLAVVSTQQNVCISDKAHTFGEKLIPYIEKYGKEMVREFYNYWTETNKSGKMRFEGEKFFDVAKRLARWNINNRSGFGRAQRGMSISETIKTMTAVQDNHINIAAALNQ